MARHIRFTVSTFLPRPYLFIIGCYLLGILLCLTYRIAFYWQYREQAAHEAMRIILQAFITGLRFDTIVIAIVLLPVLIFIPWLGLQDNAVRRVTRWYATATFSLIAFGLLADIRFYGYFESHLNFLVTQYLGEGQTAWHTVWTEPMFWPVIIAWVLLTLLLWWAIGKILSRTSSVPDRHGWLNQVLWFFLFAVLMFVGIRGRTGLAPIDWGVAYRADNPFINQLGLNGVYTLGKALSEEGNDPRLVYIPEAARFPFIPGEAALDTVRAMLTQPNDRWLEPERSLRRTTTNPVRFGFKPNIVLVVMESWSGRNTGCLGFDLGLTPCFDSLAAHGILFTHFYANGTRTNYGLGAILCSFPALPGRAILTRYNASHPFVTLSEILKNRGYTNAFAYGGDIAFDNMKGFFTIKGYDRFYSDHDFGLEHVFAKWGIPDHIVFQKCVSLTDSLPRPFQLTIMTISNHEPFDLPDSSVQKFSDNSEQSKTYNAQLYADKAVGQFIDQFRTKPVFDSTVFVFVSDHCKWLNLLPSPHPLSFQIPLLIYGPSLLGTDGRRISTVGGQIDILPTLFGLLGGEYTHESWGRNLLQVPSTDSGWAVLNVANKIGFIEDECVVPEPLGLPPMLYSTKNLTDSSLSIWHQRPERFARMVRRLHAFTQLADQMSTPLAK